MRKIIMIGDSTMHFNDISTYPQTGWGQGLELYCKRDVQIINLAQNGRSTKSFISEGLFDEALSYITKGDFVICQFGHNDEKIEDKSRGTNKDLDFLSNLEFMHNEVIKKGADIVFATSISRRNFIDGLCIDSHLGYPQAMLNWANKNNYICIDLNKLTLDLYNQLGEEATKKFHMVFDKGIYKNYPNGLCDNSHLRMEGAIMVSDLFVKAIMQTNSAIKDFFINLDEIEEVNERMLEK